MVEQRSEIQSLRIFARRSLTFCARKWGQGDHPLAAGGLEKTRHANPREWRSAAHVGADLRRAARVRGRLIEQGEGGGHIPRLRAAVSRLEKFELTLPVVAR